MHGHHRHLIHYPCLVKFVHITSGLPFLGLFLYVPYYFPCWWFINQNIYCFLVWIYGPYVSLCHIHGRLHFSDNHHCFDHFSFFSLLIKCNSILWWVSCPWIPFLVFIKRLVSLNNFLKVVIIHPGVIILQLFNKPSISLSVALSNEGNFQVLFLVCLLYNLFPVWIKYPESPSRIIFR